MSNENHRKTLIVKGRDGKERECFTYGGSIRLGGNYCPKEDNPNYKCFDGCPRGNC